MPRRRPILLLAFAGCAIAFAQEAGRVSMPAPVRNYTVSFFSDEGYPWVRVLGATADLRVAQQVTLGDTTIEVYSGDENRLIESTITSPTAVLQPDSREINGPDAVKLVQADLTVEGENWTYEYLGPHEHRITLRRRAQLTFNHAMVDLLK